MTRPTKPSAGIIGLGIIGSRVAACLRKAGYQVWLWNRSPRAEPNFLSSAREVAESAQHIQLFVIDGTALLAAVDDMLPVLRPDHIIMNHATVSPKETLEAARIVRGAGAKFLDAPFTGSRDAAEAGQLTYYVGGDANTLASVQPLLEASSKIILEMGDIGHATVVKIATNMISASIIQSLAESLALLDKNGVDLHKLALALQNNASRSLTADMKLPLMLTGDFDPRFSLKNMFKDIQIALGAAADQGLEFPAAAAFAGSAMSGIQKGWGEQDFSVIARHFGYPGGKHELPADLIPGAPESKDAKAAPAKKQRAWGLFRAGKP